MFFTNIKTGLEGSIQRHISQKDSTLNFGIGSITNLLTTPSLATLMMEASIKALDPILPDDYTSIGKVIEITHDNPTIEGMTVTVKAKIENFEGNKVTFKLDAFDEIGFLGSGRHVRHIVRYDSLMKKVNARTDSVTNKDF